MDPSSKSKIPPNSKDSEMMVLGSMINNREDFIYASQELEESDFFYEENKVIFQTLQSFFTQKKPADIHLLAEELKSQNKDRTVGGVAYLVSLAQFAGTSAHIPEYVTLLKGKALLRSLISTTQNVEKKALEDPEDPFSLVEKYQISIKDLGKRFSNKLPLLSADDRLEELNALRKLYQGKKYLGLCVKTIDEFNEKLLGLRKLNLLAAAPNVGKTALTIQLALEVLLTEPDACLAYFSLEMTSLEIFTRMNLYLSEMSFRDLIFGRNSSQSDEGHFYSKDDFSKIQNASDVLKKIGHRLQILDTQNCPHIDARTVISYVDNIKMKTKCKRAIVIIDYLQVWPISPAMRFPSENEIDKWRMGEMKKIRDSMNEDPVIVISEARKPSNSNEIWGGDLSDVMGSARGTYTPDVVLLLSQLKPKALANIWEKNNMPKNIELDGKFECSDEDKPGMAIKHYLSEQGISICKLEIPKARDGMQKFNIFLAFHFHKNTFLKINWDEFKRIQLKKLNPTSHFD